MRSASRVASAVRGREELRVDADHVADPAPQVDVALALLGVDAHAELAKPVHDRDREEERRARHVVLIDRRAPGLGVPVAGLQDHPTHLGVDEAHLQSDLPPVGKRTHAARPTHGLDEARGLVEPAHGLLREPPRENERLVASRRRVAEHERVRPEDGTAEHTDAHEHLAAAVARGPVDPRRDLGGGVEEIAHGARRRRNRTRAASQARLDQLPPLSLRQRLDGLDDEIGGVVDLGQKPAEPVDAIAEAEARGREVDVARGEAGHDMEDTRSAWERERRLPAARLTPRAPHVRASGDTSPDRHA